jgi:ABC-type transport system involved in cytochrome c biogenesis permease subunit
MSATTQQLTFAAMLVYALAALLYGSFWLKESKGLRVSSLGVLLCGVGINLFQLIHRWMEAGQPPFKTLYETLILSAICIGLIYLCIELIYRARILGLPSALGCLATMIFAITRHNKDIVNLPPALQSAWFIPHVVVYFFGYAALFVAFGVALIYLFYPKPINLKRPDLVPNGVVAPQSTIDGAVRFGFAMLTMGLLIGAKWAKEAWGDYWVWDPKETWSLVSYLLFAAYLHMHYLGGWRGRKLALLVVLGFTAIMFTYLGMGLLPTAEQSAHVYQ